MGRGMSIAVRHTVIRGFSENTSTGRLGASKEFVDARDTKRDGVRPGTLQCWWGVVGVCAGGGDHNGPVAVHELTPSLRIAETFGKWQGRSEPLDGFGHVGVVQHGYYGGIWSRAVFLQHGIRGYQVLPLSSNEKEISHGKVPWQTDSTHFDVGPLASLVG
jgi:hypothetical protein